MGILAGVDAAGNFIEKIGGAIDSNVESEEERQAMLTERLRIDSGTDSWLAKNIRPVITLGCFLMQITLLIAMFCEVEIPVDVNLTVSGLLATCIGFYFNSRKNDKMSARKVAAAIRLEEIKAKVEVDKVRAQIQEDKRQKREERRAARKQD